MLRGKQKDMRLALGGLFILTSAAFGQNAGPQRFDAVSLRPQADVWVAAAGAAEPGIKISRGSIDFQWVSIFEMIMRAYGLPAYRITHADWMEKKFSGRAVFPLGISSDTVMAMLQTMLKERFKIKAHTSTGIQKVWLLEQLPGGVKLRKSSDQPNAVVGGGTGLPIRIEAGRPMEIMTGDPNKARLVMKRGTLQQFCVFLSNELKRAVFDRTGLHDEYDIDIEAATAYPATIPAPVMAAVPPPAPPPPPLVLGPALKRIGLALRSAKEPVEVLIVDAGQPTPVSQ